MAEKKRHSRFGFLIAALVNLILIYVTGNLLNWHAPFLTKEFIKAFPYIRLSLLINFIGNLFFAFLFSGVRLRAIVRLTADVPSFIAVYTLFVVFPFDFSGYSWLAPLASIGLVLGMIGIVIGAIVDIVRLIIGRPRD